MTRQGICVMDVLTYQCPQCGAPLTFHEDTQRWDCAFCMGSFDVETLKKLEQEKQKNQDNPEPETPQQDAASMTEYTCPQCGAHIVTEETTAATFCVFCQNPTIFPEKLQGAFQPAKVIPFVKTKEDAQKAFQKLCSKKPLLPKDFYAPDRIEKITGVYVPFWLFDCDSSGAMTASATRVHTWSDRKYRYTKTDYYRIERAGILNFGKIPADGSKKMDNALMDSIEPYDMSKMIDFTPAYLAGFLAERYDEDHEAVYPRIKTRVEESLENALRNTIDGYTGVMIQDRQFHICDQGHRNVLFPVWMLMSKYKGKDYLFAMNGQTGKIVGDLPISKGRAAAWFAGITAAASLLLFLGGLLF